MDFVHVHDIARANLLAAKSDVTDEVFNVASGEETSLRQLAELLTHVMGASLEPQFGPARKVNAVPRRLADHEQGRSASRLQVRDHMEEGLRGLVAWWRQEKVLERGRGAA
jgi:UDP-glucose 4-epimerase